MATPKIFYFCYDHQHPTGGQKRTYRHVDILNQRCGLEAYVLHMRDQFRLTWFPNATRVVGLRQAMTLYNPQDDYVVLPEDLGRKIAWFPGKKIIFNKGIYRGFHELGLCRPEQSPYLDQQVLCAFAISEHNRSYLQFAYPHLPVFKVETGIDSRIFSYRPLAEKTPAIACCPKGLGELLTIHHAITARGATGLNRAGTYRWVVLNEKSESEVAGNLADAMVFIFLGFEEGFARMPLEAMMCGCLTVGHQVGALKELPPFACDVPLGDPMAAVVRIERLLTELPERAAHWQAHADANRATSLTYSSSREETSVREAWDQVMALNSVAA